MILCLLVHSLNTADASFNHNSFPNNNFGGAPSKKVAFWEFSNTNFTFSYYIHFLVKVPVWIQIEWCIFWVKHILPKNIIMGKIYSTKKHIPITTQALSRTKQCLINGVIKLFYFQRHMFLQQNTSIWFQKMEFHNLGLIWFPHLNNIRSMYCLRQWTMTGSRRHPFQSVQWPSRHVSFERKFPFSVFFDTFTDNALQMFIKGLFRRISIPLSDFHRISVFVNLFLSKTEPYPNSIYRE